MDEIKRQANAAANDLINRLNRARYEVQSADTPDDLVGALEEVQRVIDEGAWGTFRQLLNEAKGLQDGD